MATNGHALLSWSPARTKAIVAAAYGLGALLLAGEAAVHVQQYGMLFHGVRWVGPMFLADAVLCAVAIAGLAYKRTRRVAAFVGVAISVGALGGLVVSYGHGLFGWQEAGFRPPVAVAVGMEFGAVIFLSGALAGARSDQVEPHHQQRSRQRVEAEQAA